MTPSVSKTWSDRQPGRPGRQPAPACVGVHPPAELALDLRGPVEPQHRAEDPVVVGIRDRPRDALPGGLELPPPLDVVVRVVERVRRRLVPQPVLGVRLSGALVDPRGVVLAYRPQPEAITLEHRHLEPRRLRLARVVLEQGADPRVATVSALGQVAAQGALDREAEPPGQPAARPVAGEGLPDDRLEVELGEAPVHEQPQRPQHRAGAARVGVRPVGDLGATRSLVPQRDGAGVPALELDGEAPLGPVDPARRHVLQSVFAGVRLVVRRRHRRPRDRHRVATLLHLAGYVVVPVRPQRHDAVGEGGGGRRDCHSGRVVDAAPGRKQILFKPVAAAVVVRR